MLIYIKELLQVSKLQIQWDWIKGHQDRLQHIDQLDLVARLNVKADQIAEEGYGIPSHEMLHFPSTKISVMIDKQYVSDNNMRKVIEHAHHFSLLRDYLQDKYNWDAATFAMIDFDSFESAYHSQPIHNMTNVIKYIHGWQNVGYQKLQFNNQTMDATCTLCKETEHQHHYLYCTHPEAQKQRRNAWRQLKKRLENTCTHPRIISTISLLIKTLLAG